MDGDNDDSVNGVLMAGQSYILYIRENVVNDDAPHPGEGSTKQDGDYFIKVIHFTRWEEMKVRLYHEPDVIILDYFLSQPDDQTLNGKNILNELVHSQSNIPVLMLTASSDMKRAVELLQKGAVDYIIKDAIGRIFFGSRIGNNCFVWLQLIY